MSKEEQNHSPNHMLRHFEGRSLKSILTFTILIHAVVLLGTSIPFLMETVTGKDLTGLSEEERIEKAVREATSSLRDIAEKNGLKAQDLSSQFEKGKRGKDKAPKVDSPKKNGADQVSGSGDGKEKGLIEKELDVIKPGPAKPALSDPEEDLFE